MYNSYFGAKMVTFCIIHIGRFGWGKMISHLAKKKKQILNNECLKNNE